MAIAMEPCDPGLQALMTLSSEVNKIMRETDGNADLPFVEGIRMLVEKAEKYVGKISKNKGIMAQKRKNGCLTKEEENLTIQENVELQLRAEKLMEIAEPAFKIWELQVPPPE